jgi:WD40 repeat protein
VYAIHTPKAGETAASSPVVPDALQPEMGGAPTEVLFPEARRREHRRRLAVALAVLVVAGGVSAGLVASGNAKQPSGRPATIVAAAHVGLTLDAKAFSGEGDLAFVSRGSLFILEGRTARLAEVKLAKGLVATGPTFSRDGGWLAFEATPSNSTGREGIPSATQVWIARANGSAAERLPGGDRPLLIGWSPRTDEFAFAMSSGGPQDRPEAVAVWSPSGGVHVVMRATTVTGGAWSPDGSSIVVGASTCCYAAGLPFHSTLLSYTVSGGASTTWISNRLANGGPGAYQGTYWPIGWWKGWGVVFLIVDYANGPAPSNGEITATGSEDVFGMTGPKTGPRAISNVLADGDVGGVTYAPNGMLALTSNSSARPIWQTDDVEICRPTQPRCDVVPSPPGTVAMDATLAPDGSTLAYVVGKSSNAIGFPQSQVEQWYDGVSLWFYDTATGRSHQVKGIRGAVTPIWSSTGHQLLYTADDGLWLRRDSSHAPQEIVSPLLPRNDWGAYYGQIGWEYDFAWSRSAPLILG